MDYKFNLQLEDAKLVLISSSALSNFLNNKVYKLKLKKYVSTSKIEENKIFFKKEIGYIKYKKIIEIMEAYSSQNNINFSISEEIKRYIDEREMYIKERSRVGLGIKRQSEEILKKYHDYRKIIDEQITSMGFIFYVHHEKISKFFCSRFWKNIFSLWSF